MRLGTKITLFGSVGVLAAVGSTIAGAYSITRSRSIEQLRITMTQTLNQADTITSRIAALHDAKAFDKQRLAVQAGVDLKNTVLYKAIPVVAGWDSIRKTADQLGYEFSTPSRPDLRPRNPQNRRPEFDPVFAAFAGGESEYFKVDEKNNLVTMAKPVKLLGACLSCHGDPATSATGDGRDATGTHMENMRTGDIKGAFVLTGPIPSNRAALASISLIGFAILGLVAGASVWLNQKMIVRPLNKVATEITQDAEGFRQTAAQLAEASNALSRGSTSQAAAVEEASASLKEINGLTENNRQGAASAVQLTREAETAMNDANQRVDLLSGSMKGITASAHKISKIIKVVEEIAFQTNLLALNAAVEAVRAGQAGLGFAVVADEVRQLAARSSDAARETTALIEEAIGWSDKGAKGLEEVMASINLLANASQRVATLIDGVSASSDRQARGIQELMSAMQQIERVTQQSAASAEETAAVGSEAKSRSESMEEVVSGLRRMIQ